MNTYVELQKAMANRNIPAPIKFIADGLLHNYGQDGKPKNGPFWYCLVGKKIQMCTFGETSAGTKGIWYSGDMNTVTEADCNELHACLEHSLRAAGQQIQSRLTKEREYAQQLFSCSEAKQDHPYLVQHQVKSFGLRVNEGYLLVPMRDVALQLRSIQRISNTGVKEILLTDFESGCYFAIGKPSGTMVVCLDYVSAASIHMATGWSTAVAFQSENIEPVAAALRKKFPTQRIVIAADDEWMTSGNPSLTAAYAAAKRLGVPLAFPLFKEDRPASACNFNDMHLLHGLDAVRAQLMQAMEVKHAD